MSGLAGIEITLVDDHAFGFGTFQSHNQKVVSNRNGLFITHIRARNEAYTAQQWRLSHSADGGRRFTTLYEATDATKYLAANRFSFSLQEREVGARCLPTRLARKDASLTKLDSVVDRANASRTSNARAAWV